MLITKAIPRSVLHITPTTADQFLARAGNFAEDLFNAKCLVRQIEVHKNSKRNVSWWGSYDPRNQNIHLRPQFYRDLYNFYEYSYPNKPYTLNQRHKLYYNFRAILHELVHSTNSLGHYLGGLAADGRWEWYKVLDEGSAEWASEYFLLDFLQLAGVAQVNPKIAKVPHNLKLDAGHQYSSYQAAFYDFTQKISDNLGCDANKLRLQIVRAGRGLPTLVKLSLLELEGPGSNSSLNLKLSAEKAWSILQDDMQVHHMVDQYKQQLRVYSKESQKLLVGTRGLKPERSYIKAFPK